MPKGYALNRWTTEQINYLLDNYENKNIPMSKIVLDIGKNITSIKSKASYLKLNRVKFSINENYFDKIDTWEKCYILGWLWSDGNIHKKTGSIVLGLQEEDKSILDFIKNEISFGGELHYQKPTLIRETGNLRKPQYKLIFTNKSISNNLLSFGMTPNKSLILNYPKVIPIEFENAFVLGYFEGDGCIRIDNHKSLHISMRGTFEVLSKIREIIVKNCEVNSPKMMQDNPLKNNFKLEWRGNIQGKRIRNWLYKDSKFSLKRKYEKFYSQ